MSAPGQDPNKIDVSLNIMSDATLQAVNNLTQQLSSLREFVASQQMADNPAAQAEAAGRWIPQAGGLAYTPGQVPPNRPTSPIMGSDPANPSQGAVMSAARRRELQDEYRAYMESVRGGGVPSSLSQPAESMMAHHISDIDRWRLAGAEKRNPNLPNVTSRIDRFFQLYPGVARDPGEDRTFEDVSGTPRVGGSALPEGMGYPAQGPPTTSPMATFGDIPPNVPPNAPGWAMGLGREGISPESRLGLTIPRLGEFTIQDKLNMYAQWMGRMAMRRDDIEQPGRTTNIMGRTAAGAAYLRDQSAALVAVGREFQRVREFARGEELSGEALGFSRESALGDVEAFGVGARLNLGITSAAQREALRQEITQRRVQAAPGVSGDEAQRIRQTVAGMGYSQDLNERLQMDLFRPLMQRGIAPEATAPLVDQGIRQGNMSIASLRDTMIDLADAARNANMTLEDVTESSLEYAEGVQEIGANYEAALRNATTFTRSGLDPRIAGQAMQSPMVQGILSMQTGLPPQLQGTVAAPGVMSAMGQAIEQGLALGSPFANLPDRTMRTASGQEITISTGRDAQIAMAQQTTGLPRQIIERYMDNPDFLQAGGLAQTMVGQMQDQIRGMTNRERTRTVRERIPGARSREDQRQIARFGHSFGDDDEARYRTRTITESYTAGLTAEQRRALESGSSSDDVIQYKELEAQMIAMDPENDDWKARVRKISKDHSKVEDRLHHAQRIIGEAVNVKPEPDYLVGLTPEARKILKIEKPKERDAALPRANAGGAPANAAMQGPNFPSSTGGAMSYGIPGGP